MSMRCPDTITARFALYKVRPTTHRDFAIRATNGRVPAMDTAFRGQMVVDSANSADEDVHRGWGGLSCRLISGPICRRLAI
jgi:hypothetical protein